MSIRLKTEVWIPASTGNEEAVYELAKVLSKNSEKEHLVKSVVSGNEFVVQSSDIMLTNPRVESDMTSLYHINDAGILHNLKTRSENDQPYTLMGSVLVAVNPLHEIREEGITAGSSKISVPHPFSVAENAFRAMKFGFDRRVQGVEMPVNQSVVISGESGSGKTESSKRVLRHLVVRAVGGSEENKLDLKLAGVNPILESFGNAQTICNHNSSRFGKFSKLHFSQSKEGKIRNWTLIGATVETYLLEKSRVIHHNIGERNFHVFYQLVRGADASTKKALGLDGSFKYLTQQSATHAPDIKNGRSRRRIAVQESSGIIIEPSIDQRNFKELLEALQHLGKSQSDIQALLATVAAVLHVGNITIAEGDNKTSDAAKIVDTKSLTIAASLLGVSPDKLAELFLIRKVKAGNEVITTYLDPATAIYSRDAVAKWLYSSLFSWLVSEINSVLITSKEDLPFIGVLDIFGFECFKVNGFEQLLINYTNESLQSTFNYQVFVAEAEIYKEEGLMVDGVACPSGDENCLKLLGGSCGLLMEIDSESRVPKPADEKMNRRLHTVFGGKNKAFIKPRPAEVSHKFIVNHYAGSVEYTVGTFIEKNNDRVPAEMHQLFAKYSENIVVASAFATSEGTVTTTRKSATVVATFGKQIQGLVDTLENTKCSFIRCVKPNKDMLYCKNSNWFNNKYVNDQLRCLSIPQTAAVLKSGLPTRIEYESIVRAYQQALPSDICKNRDDPRMFVSALFWAFRVPAEAFRLGLTRVFFRSGMIDLLDRIMNEAKSWIQTDSPEKQQVISRFTLFYARARWRNAFAKIVAVNAFKRSLNGARFRIKGADTIRSFVISSLFRIRLSKRIAAKVEAKKKIDAAKNMEMPKVKNESQQHRNEPQQNNNENVSCTNSKLPPLHLDLTPNGSFCRKSSKIQNSVAYKKNWGGGLRTPRGSFNPELLELVDHAQANLKKDNESLKKDNAQLKSDLQLLREDIDLLRRSCVPLVHILHVI